MGLWDRIWGHWRLSAQTSLRIRAWDEPVLHGLSKPVSSLNPDRHEGEPPLALLEQSSDPVGARSSRSSATCNERGDDKVAYAFEGSTVPRSLPPRSAARAQFSPLDPSRRFRRT